MSSRPPTRPPQRPTAKLSANPDRSPTPAQAPRGRARRSVLCPPADGVPRAEVAGPEPVSIRIPDLGVDGNAVRPVGVEPNGDYEVPIASEVGWYKFGSAPGEPGSSVLAGHIAYNGANGVFVDLSKVEIGARVELTLDDGRSLTYEVVELATYVKTELPFDDIFNESGPDRVVLITCGGTFNPALRSYESNVVAYAEPVA